MKKITLLFIFSLISCYSLSLTAVLDNTANPKKSFTIVLDPGHGGKDSGALGKTALEKNIVLDIALIIIPTILIYSLVLPGD